LVSFAISITLVRVTFLGAKFDGCCRETLLANYRCLKSLEPMGILIIFLILIFRLNVNVKRLKMALTFGERVDTLHFGDS
jgi:hypothetical protein